MHYCTVIFRVSTFGKGSKPLQLEYSYTFKFYVTSKFMFTNVAQKSGTMFVGLLHTLARTIIIYVRIMKTD